MKRYIGIDAFAMVESLRTGSFQNRAYKKVGEFTSLAKSLRKAALVQGGKTHHQRGFLCSEVLRQRNNQLP